MDNKKSKAANITGEELERLNKLQADIQENEQKHIVLVAYEEK